MKKYFYLLSFIFYLLSFTFPSPAHASFFDFLKILFPPIIMQSDPKHAIPPKTNVNEIGVYGTSNSTHNNTLNGHAYGDIASRLSCKISKAVSGGWNAPPETCHTNDKGEEVCQQKPTYNANNLKGKSSFDGWSNNLTNQVIAQYYGRGITSDDINKTMTNFKSMGLDGFNVFSKIYSTSQHKKIVSDTLRHTMIAIKEEPNDTDYTDLQRGWECNGNFVEMDNTKDYRASCRPVTILEAVYYFYKNNIPILYKDDLTPDPTYPEQIVNYPTKYTETHGIKLTLNLSQDTYQNIIDKFIVTALGPGLTNIIDNNFDNICSEWPSFEPCEKNPKKYKFVTPNSLTGLSQFAQIASYSHQDMTFNISGVPGINPLESTANQYGVEPFAQPFDCDNVIENSENVYTTPNVLENIISYINGRVRSDIDSVAEPHWSYTDNIVREFQIPYDTAKTVQMDTNHVANLLPDGYPEATKLYEDIKSAPASSKTCKDCPPQSGYQYANKLFPAVRCYLHPVSWQKQHQEVCPDSSTNTL